MPFTFTKIPNLRSCCIVGSFLISLIVCLTCVAQTAQGQKPGSLSGRVLDENNLPLSGASINIEKPKKGTTTSVSGDFVIPLIPGLYAVTVSSVGYDSKRITGVVIKANNQTDITIILTLKKNSSLQTVVVTSDAKRESASSLLRSQKNNVSMTDGISADQMRATPDLNIGQSLVRVSGVNVQGGKFVTIRGVSDRYNNVLINGASLPSTEPNRRNFSFDIVPSSLVDNVVVNKTASPDLPGEFTGGLVQVTTKDVPSKNFLDIAVGTGINTETIDKDFVSFKRDRDAAIGKIDKEKLWFGKGRYFEAYRFFEATNTGDIAATKRISSKIPNRWQYYKYGYSPVQNYQVTGGLSKRFKEGRSFGVVASVTYLNDQYVEDGNAKSITNFDYESIRYRINNSIGALLNTAYKTSKHKVAWKNLYNQRYNNQVDDRSGLNISASTNQRRFSDVTFLSKLFQSRLEGEHILSSKNIKADWYGDYISYSREQPDARYLVTLNPPQYGFDFAEKPLSYGGLFSSVFSETKKNAGVNISVPLIINNEKQIFKTGYFYSNRQAGYENTGLRILTSNIYAIGDLGSIPYYQVVTDEKISDGILYYYPAYSTNASTGDKYSGTQILQSVYAMADLKIFKKLRVTGGVRNENNLMKVTSIKFVSANGVAGLDDTTATYRDIDWLPSANIIYSVHPKINIRAAYSKTIARPDFVERSYVQYYDFADQLFVYGDAGLKITRVKNYDLRFEYYPTGAEILSFSLFYKDFKNPVERFYRPDNPSNSVQYRNQPTAEAHGFEIDIRKSLGFIKPVSSVLQYIFVNGNLTLLKGKVNPAYAQVQKRPIQGLAPYIINAGILFQKDLWGCNITFNQSGRKIVNAGEDEPIIQYENPRGVLDLQLNAKLFKKKLEIRFNIGDILNQPYIIYSNAVNTGGGSGVTNNDPKGEKYNEAIDFTNYKVKRGTNILLNATYKF